MPNSLVIVESPAKARTIGKFLGRGFTVKASLGHVRDLPRSQFGVDVEAGFEPKYITIRGKGPIVKELREAAKKVKKVYLATDPDREGEAISWHLAHLLDLNASEPCRIEFHEITKGAIQAAVKKPRRIDADLVNAQQARRILDRVVGYGLSPLLWQKVRRGLSAGRVQSVAVRLICDRAREIEAFVPVEYWSIAAHLLPPEQESIQGGSGAFEARLTLYNGEKIELPDKAAVDKVLAALAGKNFRVSEVRRKERRRYPAPPFITSSLQQEASRKLGFSARKTMQIAQQLYEGLEVGEEGSVGLITYMRTDATRVAAEAQEATRQFVAAEYGKPFVPPEPPRYKSKAGAQGAHEAVRPTSVHRTPEAVKRFLKRDQYRLYRLIWERFVASQMAPAVLDTLTMDIESVGFTFRVTGSVVKFPGFMKVYTESRDDQEQDEGGLLPELAEGTALKLVKLDPKQHFTQPPPKYTEAMLVKSLEELGIGRPSTYAPTIDTIQKRGYVQLLEKRFEPTELGFIVVDLLKEFFPEIIDVEFTASMEAKLDEVEEGERDWVEVLKEFYTPFARTLEQAREEIGEVQLRDEETDEVCELCGRKMVIKQGRYGRFLACPGFPECKNTKPIYKEVGVPCPLCGGPIVERRSKRGRIFYGCKNYPECDFVSWNRPVPKNCPKCGHFLVAKRRQGQEEHVCSNEACGYREKAAPQED
ncbi:MAG: type I DNA topoisomerase [Firmicutes bacterium]|nr:type I DNA topoisomerase [Bacillota bacterium]